MAEENTVIDFMLIGQDNNKYPRDSAIYPRPSANSTYVNKDQIRWIINDMDDYGYHPTGPLRLHVFRNGKETGLSLDNPFLENVYITFEEISCVQGMELVIWGMPEKRVDCFWRTSCVSKLRRKIYHAREKAMEKKGNEIGRVWIPEAEETRSGPSLELKNIDHASSSNKVVDMSNNKDIDEQAMLSVIERVEDLAEDNRDTLRSIDPTKFYKSFLLFYCLCFFALLHHIFNNN